MQIRKLSKKIIFSLSVIFVCANLSAIDLSLRVQPSYELPLNGFLNKAGGFGVNAGLDLSPITIRSRDQIYVSGQFTYSGFYVEGFGLQSLLDGSFGFGYKLRFMDRWAAFAEGMAGIWTFPSASKFDAKTVSGLSFSGTVKTRSRPRKSSREKAKAASVTTATITTVVTTVKISVFSRYRPSGTVVKASA